MGLDIPTSGLDEPSDPGPSDVYNKIHHKALLVY